MSTPIEVVSVNETGLMKDPHPMGKMPTAPVKSEFKEEAKYLTALDEYAEEKFKWNEVDKTLKTYQTESMVCDSGIIVGNHCLRWHPGKKYKAILLKEGVVQII